MRRASPLLPSLLVVVGCTLTACGGDEDAAAPIEADASAPSDVGGGSSTDTAPSDTLAFPEDATLDDGSADTFAADTAVADTSITDAIADTSITDTFAPDTASADTFAPDTASADTFAPEVGDANVDDTSAADVLDGALGDSSAPDTFVADAGPSPSATSAQIAAVRAETAWPASHPIDGAYVTYLKPTTGTESAGFFLQAEAAGPAIFVAVDPATLPVVVGDRVQLTATDATTSNGLKQITSITGFARWSSGHSVAPLVTDVSSASDPISALDGYESRLVKVSGTIAAAFVSASAPHVSARITTLGVTTASSSLVLRIPETVRASFDLAPSCTFRLDAGPMWRFNAIAQPSSYSAADFSSIVCPAPKVASAIAASSTAVNVTFDRRIDPTTVLSSGAQFTIPGLTVTAATVAGANTITLTTDAQTAGTSYTVTVASTVKDTLGTALGTPNTATFAGWTVPAVLRINEVAPNITGGADLIELLVVGAGTLEGITVQQNLGTPTKLITFPAVTVSTGDLLVVHLNAPMGVVNETSTLTDCVSAACYAGARDFVGSATGLTYSSRVLAIADAFGNFQDIVPFALSTGTPPTSFAPDLQTAQALGHWLPVDCGGVPCSLTSTPTAIQVSADWTGVGTTTAGNSVQRIPGPDTNMRSDWKVAPATLGAPN